MAIKILIGIILLVIGTFLYLGIGIFTKLIGLDKSDDK